MENNLQIYANDAFGEIRGLMINGEPYFIGKDVAAALGYTDTDQALRKHVKDKHRLTRQINGSGQKRNMTLIDEAGLYSLIMRSALPAAEEFQEWVTAEVLPSIRKTGTYEIPRRVEETKPSQMVTEINAMSEALQATFGVQKGIALIKATDAIRKYYRFDLTPLKELVPPAKHEIGTLTPTGIGKQIGLSARKVNEKLTEMGLQYRDGDETA